MTTARTDEADDTLDDEDELDDDEREALDAAISRSLEQARAGQTAPAEAILAKLRSR